MKKLFIALAIILIPLTYNKYNSEEQVIIPNDAIRIRVIANSNSLDDQQEKLVVRKNLQIFLSDLLKDAKTKEETEETIKSNISNINQNITDTLNSLESKTKYETNYGLNYFPEKEFKGITYESGYYDSLVVTLGKGKGNNWWCVLFPPLCLLPTEEENITDVEYGFFVNEVISNYK